MSFAAQYTAASILEAIDGGRRADLPCFDGGTTIHADGRVTVYRDQQNWAIVIENLSTTSKGPGPSGIVTELFKYGNCISHHHGIGASRETVSVIENDPDQPLFIGPLNATVNPNCKVIRIRSVSVPIDLSSLHLQKKQIPLPQEVEFKYMNEYGEIKTQTSPAEFDQTHVVRTLLPENRGLLLATDAERRRGLPADLPLFMQLEEWHHPLFITTRATFGETETFQMLSRAIEYGDAAIYAPTSPPNSHWKHWLQFEHI